MRCKNLNNNYMMKELIHIQEEYKEILEKLYNDKDNEDFFYVMDEIGLFWYSNRNVVELILENISDNFESYLFTGATYLDIEAGEHYPFVALGKIHIVDDPLAKYAEVVKMNFNNDFYKVMKRQILLAFQDDLLVLRKCLGKIFLLPVTGMSKLEDGLIKNASEKVILSMFKNDLSMKEVLSMQTIRGIVDSMREGVKGNIIFFDDEDRTQDISERFNNYLEEMKNSFGDIPDSIKFIYSIMGFVSQSLQILLSAAQYKMIPYIRYGVTFNYLSLIGENFLNIPFMKEVLYKTSFTYLFYKNFDFEINKAWSFDKYCKIVDNLDIISELEQKVDGDYKRTKESYKIMNKIINNKLNNIKNYSFGTLNSNQ